jgi:ssDNA-binding Zn-finger/Zn-ribbon topoisomerase 1
VQAKKSKRECPECGADLKRTIGAVSRKKFWICTKGGESCYKAPISATLTSNPW